MSRSTLRRRSRFLALLTAGTMALSGSVIAPSVANADEVEEVTKKIQDASFEVTRKHEELKNLDADIDKREEQIGDLGELAEKADSKAQLAQDSRFELQATLDELATTQYNGAKPDPITASLGAQSPQDMIERTAFVGTLSRQAAQTISELEDSTRQAADEASKANADLQAALFQRNNLEFERNQLQQERDELEAKISDLEAQVDALSEEERDSLAQAGAADLAEAGQALMGADGSGAVGAALSKIGSPYGWGAAGPSQFDCSGLMLWAYQQQGKTIPRTSQAQLAGGTSVSVSDLQPGDIVGYYPGTTHVGMYIGDGQVVHASTYGVPVQVVPVDSMPITGAARY